MKLDLCSKLHASSNVAHLKSVHRVDFTDIGTSDAGEGRGQRIRPVIASYTTGGMLERSLVSFYCFVLSGLWRDRMWRKIAKLVVNTQPDEQRKQTSFRDVVHKVCLISKDAENWFVSFLT